LEKELEVLEKTVIVVSGATCTRAERRSGLTAGSRTSSRQRRRLYARSWMCVVLALHWQ
jgi:hypothetical protein